MSDEDKAILLGQILGKVEILVPSVAALDKKLDKRVDALYLELSKQKVRLYWMSGILVSLIGAEKGAKLLGFF